MSGETATISVLAVDDEPALLDLLKALFAREPDFRLTPLASARDAVPLIEAADPDVLLLDLLMPDVSGLELLRELRGRARPLRAVILTGRDGEEGASEALNLGVDFYLRKWEAFDSGVHPSSRPSGPRPPAAGPNAASSAGSARAGGSSGARWRGSPSATAMGAS